MAVYTYLELVKGFNFNYRTRQMRSLYKKTAKKRHPFEFREEDFPKKNMVRRRDYSHYVASFKELTGHGRHAVACRRRTEARRVYPLKFNLKDFPYRYPKTYEFCVKKFNSFVCPINRYLWKIKGKKYSEFREEDFPKLKR